MFINSIIMFIVCFKKKKERWKFNKDKGMVNFKVGGGFFFVLYDK